MSTDTVTITGNLTRDPELRFGTSGQANVNLSLAVNRRWQNRQTEAWEESTSFFDVVAWGTLAENAAQSLTKGTRVIVSGRLDQRSWETTEGDRRSKVEIKADEIAPSLRFAVATVTRNDRTAAAQPSGSDQHPSSNRSYASASAGSYDGDDAPF